MWRYLPRGVGRWHYASPYFCDGRSTGSVDGLLWEVEPGEVRFFAMNWKNGQELLVMEKGVIHLPANLFPSAENISDCEVRELHTTVSLLTARFLRYSKRHPPNLTCDQAITVSPYHRDRQL